MSDAPEEKLLQPITMDRHGIFWAIFWPYCIKYRVGNGERQRATAMVGLSKGLCAALSRCPEIRKPLRYYQYRCYFLLALTALAGGITGAALALMVASMLSILPYSIVLLLTDNFPALVSFTLILGLILTGISYLLVVDLARDFYRMIDRYNAYVAEQAKAKAESPRPA